LTLLIKSLYYNYKNSDNYELIFQILNDYKIKPDLECLKYAKNKNKHNIINILLKNIDIESEYYDILIRDCKYYDIDSLELIIFSDKINLTLYDLKYLLHHNCSLKVVRYFVDKGIYPDEECMKIICNNNYYINSYDIIKEFVCKYNLKIDNKSIGNLFRYGDYKLYEILVDNGYKLYEILLDNGNKLCDEIIDDAISSPEISVDIVKMLLKYGVPANTSHIEMTIKNNTFDKFIILINHNVKLTLDCLKLACYKGNSKFIDKILNKGIIPDKKCFYLAFRYCDKDTIMKLYSSNKYNIELDEICMIEACKNNNNNSYKIINLLLENNIYPNTVALEALCNNYSYHNSNLIEKFIKNYGLKLTKTGLKNIANNISNTKLLKYLIGNTI